MRPCLFLSLLLLAGCVTPRGWTESPEYSPQLPAERPLIDANGGFLYDGGSPYAPKRARAVGDLLTIRIVHDVSAKSGAATDLSRKGALSGGVTAMFGLETQLGKLPEGGPGLSLEASSSNTHNGSGKTSRSGSLSGTLSARVIEVLSNGQLVVAARQAVMINDEVEFLGVRGIVEPRAIAADNSVLSTAIADLRVEYAGQGVVAGKQAPGWLARILDAVAPF